MAPRAQVEIEAAPSAEDPEIVADIPDLASAHDR